MNKKLIFLVVFLVIIQIVVAINVNFDVKNQKMEQDCDDYLSNTEVGEQRCCQIGWSYNRFDKAPLKRCIILQ